MYELFEHTADLGLRVRSSTLEELFLDAASGLLAMLVANPEGVRAVETKTISLTADDLSYLLFDWLTELLYAFETDKVLFSTFELKIDGKNLTATCRGERMDETRHRMEHEVKAITYHGLRVEQAESGWEAEIIVDI
jgi:SHS2 domain-containing protein